MEIFIKITSCILMLISSASAYYCEWNLCDSNSYCCGNNQCCSNSYSPWYFWWAGAFIMLFVMWICNGALRYYRAKQQTQTSGIKYQDLETANRQLEDKATSGRSPL